MIAWEHLIGLEFKHGSRDCYEMLRDVYRETYGIELPPVARPDEWWDHNMNLYIDHAFEQGFRQISENPREWKEGDVFLMAIRSQVGNHVGIHLGDGYMLHHFYGRRSERVLYNGIWRNTTVGVFRHKDVLPQTVTETIELDSLIPPHLLDRASEQAP